MSPPPVIGAPLDPEALLGWHRTHGRHDLPWRASRDPWAVLVSEVMLQQTQVVRVVAPWSRFLERWPTPAALAQERPARVVTFWTEQRLGYPRRARFLHAAASAIVVEHDGVVPTALDDLLGLPGVGPYTSRAVAAFAHEADVGVVDTNVARVLARTADARLSPSQAQRRADALVPAGHGWAWNQAMLDVGARHCRPRPVCGDCPLADGCGWFLHACSDPDPAVGSAGVSTPQARFDGSDRQGRGRLLAALAERERVPLRAIGPIMGWPDDPDRADRVLAGLERDGLVTRRAGFVVLAD